MADDLGYGHLGCYGQELIKTPNVDRLASEGMRFTNAYAGASVCAPSRSVLMTGYHGGKTSVRGNGGGISLLETDVTIAQILKGRGYVTGIFGKMGLGDEGSAGEPNKKGFDEFFGYMHQLHAQFYYPEFIWHNQEKVYLEGNRNLGRRVYAHDLIVEKAIDFISKNKDTTFFCYLPVQIPHHEFIVPSESLKLYEGKFDENPVAFWRDGYALPKAPRATLAAMITHLDSGVGKIVGLLKQLGIEENTLVIFTSDNGGAQGALENAEFFNANGILRGYKGGLYEGGIRVPFVAWWPRRVEPGTVNDHVFYFADLLPTLAELAGADLRGRDVPDGISIVPSLLSKGRQKKHEFLYWEAASYRRVPPYDMEPTSFHQAVRLGKWKAVRKPDGDIELYDLHRDPAEEYDISDSNNNIVERINSIMARNHIPAPPQACISGDESRRKFLPRRVDE